MTSVRSWLHHDGSELYVSNAAPQLDEIVEVRLRVAAERAPEQVWVRAVHDGEPRYFEARFSHESPGAVWWVCDLPIRNPRQNYRWRIVGERCGDVWLNAAGAFDREVPDGSDFAIAAVEPTPEWALSAVVYQIFPDRFASSGRSYDVPEWAVPRNWGEHPEGRSRNTGREYFGGDLWGVAERLDYLQALGVNVVYSTPFFPAHTTHRYDALDFDQIDPLLGGDEALIHLVEQAHARGMKVIGDITLNHCGNHHAWFLRAQEGDPETREFFYFDESLPHGYECWFGHRHLPKFNYESQRLREELITGENSVLRKWLRPPFSLDGWRVDVANMSGRNGAVDLTLEVARLARAAVRAEGADKVLIAEHFHDAGADLAGDGWHGTMAYTNFARPVWNWLVSDEFETFEKGRAAAVRRRDGLVMAETMQDFSSRMPWRSRIASWVLLGSHDTARVRTVVGSGANQEAAVGLLVGMPGTPMIFMGDELGFEGWWGEDARTTMPWDSLKADENPTFAMHAELFKLRANSPALARGGLRWLAVADDLVVFERACAEETLVFAVARGAASVQVSEMSQLGLDCLYGSASVADGEVVATGPGTTIWRAA